MADLTYYVVLTFDRDKRGFLKPGKPDQVPSAEAAKRRVASRASSHAGVVAFSRTGNPAVGDFQDAVILARAGEVDLDLLSE